MKFQVPEGLTLTPYEDPEKTGWYGYLKDAEDKTVGFLKDPDDEKFVTVAEAEELAAKKKAEDEAGSRPQAKTSGNGGGQRKRARTNPTAGLKPKKGERPSLHQLNRQVARNEKRLRKEKDPTHQPFRTIEESRKFTAKVMGRLNDMKAQARREANKIIEDAKVEAEKVLTEALEDAEKIRSGAKLEAAASGAGES